MTPQLVQIFIGLIGALLGIAVTWGSQRRTVDQLEAPRAYEAVQPLSWWQDVYRRGAGLYRGQ